MRQNNRVHSMVKKESLIALAFIKMKDPIANRCRNIPVILRKGGQK
ncbi:hypothetical protein IOK49_01225 [Fervidicoccus fontis]|uniref:Uncharacterized protein n=1 Tax=Fervidicoccus fontis TaxID=683846 RepID=A0A843AC84_9CREN|nr:hypothetical protein [Fervidicoccus fontis]